MKVKIKEINLNNFNEYFEEIIKLQYENSCLHFPNKIIDINNTRVKINSIWEYLKENKAYIYVATYENIIVGFIWTYPRIFFDEKRLYINSLIINSNYRGNKIGEQLVKTVEKKAKELNCDAIDVSTASFNEGGLKFYKKYGFIEERIQLFKNIRSK